MNSNFLEKFLFYLKPDTIVYIGADNGQGWLIIGKSLTIQYSDFVKKFKNRGIVEVYVHDGFDNYEPGLAIIIEGDEIGEF